MSRYLEPQQLSPAMAANVTKRLWEIGDIVDLLEASEPSNAKQIVS